MTFQEYCIEKYADEDDGLSFDEINLMLRVIQEGKNEYKYRDYIEKVWNGWYLSYGDKRRYNEALGKLYLRYINKVGL